MMTQSIRTAFLSRTLLNSGFDRWPVTVLESVGGRNRATNAADRNKGCDRGWCPDPIRFQHQFRATGIRQMPARIAEDRPEGRGHVHVVVIHHVEVHRGSRRIRDRVGPRHERADLGSRRVEQLLRSDAHIPGHAVNAVHEDAVCFGRTGLERCRK